MSIKKIPICPFCQTEMTLEGHGTAKIPYELKDLETDHNFSQTIKNYSTFEVYSCKDCGFVALWKYQL